MPATIALARATLAACAVAFALAAPAASAADPFPAAAWEALAKYEYGQDMAPLLAIDRAVIDARSSMQARADLAARLAAVLKSPQTTAAARQYICLKLRDVGTAAEVPVLAAMLKEPETSEMARWALEAIPGPASAAALLGALDALPTELVIGVINSLGARRHSEAVPKLQDLARSGNERVWKAALGALGNIATEDAMVFLVERFEDMKRPPSHDAAVALLRYAATLESSGKIDLARRTYTQVYRNEMGAGVRRAALEGLLRLERERASATILEWFTASDTQRRAVAAGHLARIPTTELERLVKQPSMPAVSRLLLLEVLASRQAGSATSPLISLAQGGDPPVRALAIRALGSIGDPSVVPSLMKSLSAGGEVAEAAEQALSMLPRKEVKRALLDALDRRPEVRMPVIEALKRMKCYEAIDPLLTIAASDDPAVYGPAMDGLRGIADPDKTDLPRLVNLVLRVPLGPHRDEAEKTVMLVCDKLPPEADRAEAVLAVLERIGLGQRAELLPLLGRLGGPKALEALKAGMADSDPKVRDAAVAGLCNWPDASVADQLLDIAGHEGDAAQRRRALRAYIRVVTLKSGRPARQTLSMLEKAMKLASHVEDKRLILQRVGTMRNLDAVLWLAAYLDDSDLGQAACAAVIEATHDRSLRSTNQDRFRPILEKVVRISTDQSIRERAKQYQLGL